MCISCTAALDWIHLTSFMQGTFKPILLYFELIRILIIDFKKGSLTVSPFFTTTDIIFAQLLEEERKKKNQEGKNEALCMIRLPEMVSSYVLVEKRKHQGLSFATIAPILPTTAIHFSQNKRYLVWIFIYCLLECPGETKFFSNT